MVLPPLEPIARAAVAGDPGALDAFHAAIAQLFATGDQLGNYLGIEILEVTSERVTMRMPWRPELQRAGGIFHGGAIMALADHVGGCLFNSDPRVVAAGETGLTTDFHASFLRVAAPREALLAEGTVLKRGRRITFIQVDVKSEGTGRILAACRATYAAAASNKVGGGS
jgi:1,4-dihydroxy-2-naphthoyl-CoA hydrolase